MLFTQDFGRDREVAIWIEQIAGVAVAMLLVTQVDLSQPRVDAGWRHFAQRFVQPVACLGVATETAGGSSDVQGPGPWDQSATTPQAALLQRNGIEHRGRNIRTLRRDLVGRRRYLLCPGERGSGDRGGQNCNQACIAVHCLCHSPPICRTTAGRSLQAQRQPAACIMVEGDGAATNTGGVNPGTLGPIADAGIILAAADHVEVEFGPGGLQLLDKLAAWGTTVLDEYGQPVRIARHAGSAGSLAGPRQADALHARMQALPGSVISTLVSQCFLDTLRFDLNLQFGVAPALFI